jgi:hypothetical protein
MVKRNRAHVALGMAAILAAGLAGCTPASFADADPKAAPTPSASAPSDDSTPVRVRPPIADSPAPMPSPSYVLVQLASFVGPYGVRQPIDHGPEQYAEGTVIRDRAGGIVAYRVASGDIYSFIPERFGLGDDDYIVVINSIRRGNPSTEDGGLGAGTLDVGDVVNLSAFTMTRYGTSAGKVWSDPPPDPMPPQQ